MSALQKFKQGKKNYKIVNFPGTEDKVAIAILTSNEMSEARIKAQEIIESQNIKDEEFVELEHQKQIVYRALRDKDDIKIRLAESFDDFNENLDNVEIQYFMVEYSLLSSETSPFLNSVDEKTFEALKKTLEKIQLNDLSGPSLIALRNFLLTLA